MFANLAKLVDFKKLMLLFSVFFIDCCCLITEPLLSKYLNKAATTIVSTLDLAKGKQITKTNHGKYS